MKFKLVILLLLLMIPFSFAEETTTVGRIIGDDVNTLLENINTNEIDLKHATYYGDAQGKYNNYNKNKNQLEERFNDNVNSYYNWDKDDVNTAKSSYETQELTIEEFELWFKSIFVNLNILNQAGIYVSSNNKQLFLKELFNLIYDEVSESKIDTFIRKNSDLFAKALGYEKALSQIELPILEEGWDKKSLIPDYMMLRKDGYYDILDLKKSVLKYKKLTMGGKSRCRFNDYGAELVSQLKGYKRYFNSEKHKIFVEKKYGIKTNKINLVGVIGNHDNFFRDEVDYATEDNLYLKIISYTELINFVQNI